MLVGANDIEACTSCRQELQTRILLPLYTNDNCTDLLDLLLATVQGTLDTKTSKTFLDEVAMSFPRSLLPMTYKSRDDDCTVRRRMVSQHNLDTNQNTNHILLPGT